MGIQAVLLPYADMEKSVAIMSTEHLFHQRRVIGELIDHFLGDDSIRITKKNRNMWLGHVPALAEYGIKICYELMRRDKPSKASMRAFKTALSGTRYDQLEGGIPKPKWWGDTAVHMSHRAYLRSKDPEHYTRYRKITRHGKVYTKESWATVRPRPLVWPVLPKALPLAHSPEELLTTGWTLELLVGASKCSFYGIFRSPLYDPDSDSSLEIRGPLAASIRTAVQRAFREVLRRV